MSKKRKETSTGIIELDEDLQELFEVFSKSTKINAVKETISDSSLTAEQFIAVVPPCIVRLSSSLLNKEKYENLLKSLSENAVSTVEKAKFLVEKHFPNILKHPAIKSLLIDEDKESETLTRDAFNTIEDITWVRTWQKTRSGLLPTARLGFKNNRGKILLDSTVDWEELGNLIYQLMRVFAKLLEGAKVDIVPEQLDLSDRDRLAREIRYMQELLDKITKFASDCEIKIEKKVKKHGKHSRGARKK